MLEEKDEKLGRQVGRVREGDGSVGVETTDVCEQIAGDDACIRVGGSNVVLLQNLFVWNGLLLRLRMWLLKTYKKSCENSGICMCG